MSEIDRISSLPDYLLHEILWYLTTKELVRTSALSKRWIHVWKSLPCLELDALDFDDVKEFVRFGNSILHHKLFPYPEQLNRFSLSWPNCEDDDYQTINSWISAIVSLKPEWVYIDFFDLDEIDSISSLFNCSTLHNLFLRSFVNPTIINLPCLKRLDIGWFHLNDDFIQRLMLGCPKLKSLVFYECFFHVTKLVTSSSLKSLEILDTHGFDDHSTLRISMPNLVNLVCDATTGHVSLEDLESLEFASLSLSNMDSDSDDFEDLKLMWGLTNANFIELSGRDVVDVLILEAWNDKFPLFDKLETLALDSITLIENLFPIDLFADHSPNLKTLILCRVLVERNEVPQEGGFKEIECRSLKTVRIEHLDSENDEQVNELAKYLLKHLKGIESVSIKYADKLDEYYSLHRLFGAHVSSTNAFFSLICLMKIILGLIIRCMGLIHSYIS